MRSKLTLKQLDTCVPCFPLWPTELGNKWMQTVKMFLFSQVNISERTQHKMLRARLNDAEQIPAWREVYRSLCKVKLSSFRVPELDWSIKHHSWMMVKQKLSLKTAEIRLYRNLLPSLETPPLSSSLHSGKPTHGEVRLVATLTYWSEFTNSTSWLKCMRNGFTSQCRFLDSKHLPRLSCSGSSLLVLMLGLVAFSI